MVIGIVKWAFKWRLWYIVNFTLQITLTFIEIRIQHKVGTDARSETDDQASESQRFSVQIANFAKIFLSGDL